MHVEQRVWSDGAAWSAPVGGVDRERAQLAWVFGARACLTADRLAEIRAWYPAARLVGCSTAGEVHGTTVADRTVVVTAVEFASTTIREATAAVSDAPDGQALGRRLGAALDPHGLKHVVVLSDGLHVNGTALVAGLTTALPPEVTLSGGLAADGTHFERTCVVADGDVRERHVVALGFYGEAFRSSSASLGGWDPFGPERMITRSNGNVLHELDRQPALELYKRYLGDQAAELPASALLFPLAVRVGGEAPVVRTILSVDEREGSMTFAGDMPQGAHARLMRANFDRLVDGAVGAAQATTIRARTEPALALLISCVGRKIVLSQRAEEEVEAVRDVLGPRVTLAGFYSYGEISPFTPGARCELHNQTMTITAFSEDAVHAPAA
ncbi:MAG: FIST C-terminal domain-containing protein [Vicinamibacterales bacterium]